MGRTAETLPESKGLVRSVKNLLQTFQQAGCSWRKLTESINTSEWQTDTHMHSYDPAWTLWDECGLWTWVTWTNWFMFNIMLLLLLYHLVIAIQQAGRGWMLEPFYLILINSIIVLWYYCLINYLDEYLLRYCDIIYCYVRWKALCCPSTCFTSVVDISYKRLSDSRQVNIELRQAGGSCLLTHR